MFYFGRAERRLTNGLVMAHELALDFFSLVLDWHDSTGVYQLADLCWVRPSSSAQILAVLRSGFFGFHPHLFDFSFGGQFPRTPVVEFPQTLFYTSRRACSYEIPVANRSFHFWHLAMGNLYPHQILKTESIPPRNPQLKLNKPPRR